ncbi:MAG: hypothetical protein IPP77_01675 [Bacteroidetes bacterium]|nr:hypothetical protein [Bacteroidota bacterium]
MGEHTALFILLTKQGIVQRKGDGNPGHTHPATNAWCSSDGHSEALMMTIPEDTFNYIHVYPRPNIIGTECRLTTIFQAKDDLDYSFRVVYGSDSEGPPSELAEILINAVKITEGWYQRQINENTPAEKKWCQVWK